MKNKCSICQKVKGKRLCKINDENLVCSVCCARIRNFACEGCIHYTQFQKYDAGKSKKKEIAEFYAKIDPEIDEIVDEALVYLEKGNINEAQKIIFPLLKTNPDVYNVQYAMGLILAMKGKYEDSIAHFDKSIEIFPYSADVWYNKAISHKNLLNISETVKSLQKILEIGDQRDIITQNAQEILSGLEATIYESTGLSLNAYNHLNEVFDYAYKMMENGEYEKAIAGFRNVLALNEDHVQSYGNLGLCYSFLGEKPKAITAYDKALKLDPDYELAYQNKAVLLSLKDGEEMPKQKIISVEYYKDRFIKSRMLNNNQNEDR